MSKEENCSAAGEWIKDHLAMWPKKVGHIAPCQAQNILFAGNQQELWGAPRNGGPRSSDCLNSRTQKLLYEWDNQPQENYGTNEARKPRSDGLETLMPHLPLAYLKHSTREEISRQWLDSDPTNHNTGSKEKLLGPDKTPDYSARLLALRLYSAFGEIPLLLIRHFLLFSCLL